MTFGEAAARWMDAQGPNLRPATRAAYESSLQIHLLPAWGNLRLDRIDVAIVASLVERMQTAEYRQEILDRSARRRAERTGRKVKAPKATTGYRPWTIRGVLTPAGRAFDFARRRLSWAGSNPVRELERNERPTHDPRERRILTRDELARLIASAEPPYREIIATAASLGTRLGETLGLTWADVDLGARVVHVRAQIDRHGQRVPLKTKRSRRVIEAPDALVSLLRGHRAASAHKSPESLVFASRTGGPLEHRNVAQRGLARAVKRAKLDASKRPPTFHELRHAHASAWIASGGDLVELSARLGHRDPAITASVYSHEFEAAARSDSRRARLDAIYAVSVAPPTSSADENEAPSSRATGPDRVVDLRERRDRVA
ncbi:MAG TPA: tyrosine-type recombinase/integrase [Solirubrobacteraceae bacterium]|nr:tyrosine-type recombinase/integrase [Solirubrobacteraceae bacterium]